MVVDSPNYSDELLHPVLENGNGRLSCLNLKDLVYIEDTTIKLRIVLAAVWKSGAAPHLTPSGLSTLNGSFKCLDCAELRLAGQAPPSRNYETMSWQQAESHILEISKLFEYQEDGEYEERPQLHLHLQYNAGTAPNADGPGMNAGWGAGGEGWDDNDWD